MSGNAEHSDSSFPGFRFEEEPAASAQNLALVVPLPASIRSKQKLLRILAQQFQFPAYFGHNWDALEECLRDLSWLPAGNIEIRHHDLPLPPGSLDRQTYLHILQSAAAFWAESSERRFDSFFPATVQAEVLSIRE